MKSSSINTKNLNTQLGYYEDNQDLRAVATPTLHQHQQSYMDLN